ncbi:MAG: hypothetical protein PHF00_01560 [Elusimicrobia bacterium]|nr:hypothetical protein [Elusimicrobiota bacterium]
MDPSLQFHLLSVVLTLVLGSVALVSYSVMRGVEEAALSSQELFHSLEWTRQAMRGPLIISGAIAVLASALVALVWSHRFAGPLRVLSGALERLAQGNFSVPIRVRRSDAHHELVGDFAAMQESLRGRLEADLRALAEASRRLREARDRIQDQEARQAADAALAAAQALESRYRL